MAKLALVFLAAPRPRAYACGFLAPPREKHKAEGEGAEGARLAEPAQLALFSSRETQRELALFSSRETHFKQRELAWQSQLSWLYFPREKHKAAAARNPGG